MSELQFDKLLLFGDSITEYAYDQTLLGNSEPTFCFAPAIHNSYIRKLDILQRGFSGYNTDWAVKLLPKIVELEHSPSSKIKMAIVFFGTNDAALGGAQKVPLDQYLANVSKCLDIFQENGIKVVLIGPAKHNQELWNKLKPIDCQNGIIRTNENNLIYSKATEELANQRQVAFVDLYTKFDQYEGDWKDLLIDGIHFTGAGYKLMFESVMSKIKEFYPELSPESLKYRFPYWRDYDKETFAKILDEAIN